MIVGLLKIVGWGVMVGRGRCGCRHTASVFVDSHFKHFAGTIFTDQGIQFDTPILLLATPKILQALVQSVKTVLIMHLENLAVYIYIISFLYAVAKTSK